MEHFIHHPPVENTSTPATPNALAGVAPIAVRDVVAILRRHMPLALITFATTLAVALAITLRMTPTYEAVTTVLLDDAPAAAVPTNVFDILNGKSVSTSDVEIAKIQSRSFLTEVLRKAGIANKMSVEEFKGRVSVGFTGGDQIMAITVTMKRDPKLTARVANIIAQVYKEYVKQEAGRKLELTEERFRRAAAKAQVEKSAANKALEAFMKKRGVSDPNSYYVKQAQKTIEIKNSIQDAERDLPVQQKRISLYADQVNTIPPTIVTGTSRNRNGQIESYSDQIIDLENQRRIKRIDFGEQSPEIIEIDRRIAAAKESIVKVTGNAYRPGSYGISRNPDYGGAVSNLINARKDLAVTEASILALQKQLSQLQAEQFLLAPERVRYQELQQRVDVTTEAYRKANAALLQIPINRITAVPNIEILDEAQVPTGPISPKPLLNAIFAVAGGLFFSVMFSIVAEYFSPTPRAKIFPDDLPSVPQLPAAPSYAENLPNVAGVPLLARVTLGNERSLVGIAGTGLPTPGVNVATEDAFREIGYFLSHPTGSNPDRVPVILLAGTRTDETTASVAAYLTATLVREGMRVTLIDGDRTEPRLHHVFGKPDAPGLTDIIAGRILTTDALHIGANGNLRFLAAGAKTDATPLSEEAMRRLYNDLGEPKDTDLVVISGPSVWSARVVATMERAADGVVLVASDAQVAPEESVARARRILTNGYQPRLIGVIVGEETAREPSAIPSRRKTTQGEDRFEG